MPVQIMTLNGPFHRAAARLNGRGGIVSIVQVERFATMGIAAEQTCEHLIERRNYLLDRMSETSDQMDKCRGTHGMILSISDVIDFFGDPVGSIIDAPFGDVCDMAVLQREWETLMGAVEAVEVAIHAWCGGGNKKHVVVMPGDEGDGDWGIGDGGLR